MASIELHACELAYAFSYAKTEEIIGWGSAPFLPAEGDDPASWYTQGEQRLRDAGRLVGTPQEGLNFNGAITADILALVNPSIVLMAERKDGDALRRMTVFAATDTFVGMTRRANGMFELTHYADLTAAAGACAGFVGASFDALTSEARVETTHKILSTLRKSADARPADVANALGKLGLSEQDAQSALHALSAPSAAGVLSVLYCASNTVQDVEAITVMTNAQDHTWLVFAPGSLEGLMILERSSVAALTARVAVGVAARLSPPQ